MISVFSGCSASGTTEVSTSPGYTIDIYLDDLQLGSIDLHDLQKLKQVSWDSNGTIEKGPTLISVLGLESIDKFSLVTVYGASGQLTLPRAQVNDNVLLGITDQGNSDLVDPDIPASAWITGVTKIVVIQ